MTVSYSVFEGDECTYDAVDDPCFAPIMRSNPQSREGGNYDRIDYNFGLDIALWNSEQLNWAVTQKDVRDRLHLIKYFFPDWAKYDVRKVARDGVLSFSLTEVPFPFIIEMFSMIREMYEHHNYHRAYRLFRERGYHRASSYVLSQSYYLQDNRDGGVYFQSCKKTSHATLAGGMVSIDKFHNYLRNGDHDLEPSLKTSYIWTAKGRGISTWEIKYHSNPARITRLFGKGIPVPKNLLKEKNPVKKEEKEEDFFLDPLEPIGIHHWEPNLADLEEGVRAGPVGPPVIEMRRIPRQCEL